MTLLQMVLKQYGFDENRFQVKYVDSDRPEAYVRSVQEFMDKIKQLGPRPHRGHDRRGPAAGRARPT